jgi:cell division cycle 14
VLLNWYDPRTFNVSLYEHYERVENGDLNWIIPGRFMAFSSPSDTADASYGFSPEQYIPIFS